MKTKIVSVILSLSVAAAALTGCNAADMSALAAANGSDYLNLVMEKFNEIYYAPTPISFDTPDAAWVNDFLTSNTEYLNRLSQTDLDFRVGKKGATLEDYKKLAEETGLTFTEEQTQALNESMAKLQERLNSLGFSYPLEDSINFVLTTMKEEGDSAAYTHGNSIFLNEKLLKYAIDKGEEGSAYLETVLAHEIFHVLTRNDRDFKENMYNIIGFTLDESEPDFSDEVREVLVSNPDVESYDSHGVFTIDGTPTEAVIVSYYSKPFEEGVSMWDSIATGVVPVEKPDRIYTIDEVPDFYDVVGSNTDYVISAEEALADNFSDAVLYGTDKEYAAPAIIDEMLAYMASDIPTDTVTGEHTVKAPSSEEDASEDEAAATERVAREVIRGMWGDGADRIHALDAAGYDSKAVQQRVNELMSGS